MMTKDKIFGTIDDIPETLGSFCTKIFPEDIERVLKEESDPYSDNRSCPGRCRFCGKSFAATHYRIEGYGNPIDYPILQCNHVSEKIWPRYESMRKRQKWEAKQKQKKIASEGYGSKKKGINF